VAKKDLRCLCKGSLSRAIGGSYDWDTLSITSAACTHIII